MNHPDFFDQVAPLVVRDPLAEVLGAAHEGLIEYRYADAVRLAGHSCPTVAGAWLLTRRALAGLYPDGRPQRGGIGVALRAAQSDGTAGVVGAVIGLITGAAGEGGFNGLGGQHVRRGLLSFGVEIPGEVRFTRLDSGASIDLLYQPQRVPPDPAIAGLMPRMLSGEASAEERARFARLWQDRVRRILFEPVDGLVEEIVPAGSD